MKPNTDFREKKLFNFSRHLKVPSVINIKYKTLLIVLFQFTFKRTFFLPLEKFNRVKWNQITFKKN